MAEMLREDKDLNRMVLSGGCFQNRILIEGCINKMESGVCGTGNLTPIDLEPSTLLTQVLGEQILGIVKINRCYRECQTALTYCSWSVELQDCVYTVDGC